MKLYKDVLSVAWHHTIHRPSLWIFGLFAAFIFGNAGEIDRYLRFMNAVSTEGHPLNPEFWLQLRWVGFVVNLGRELLGGNISTWIFVIATLIALVLVLVMMSIAAGALISVAATPARKFGEAFEAGKKHWVDLFFLFIGGYAIMAIATLIIGMMIFSVSTQRGEAERLFALIGSVVFVPLVIIISFLVRYAANSIVLQNTHIVAGLRHAWSVLRQYWLVTLEMAIVNFIVVLVLNLAILIAVGLLFTPQLATAMTVRTSGFVGRLATAIITSGFAYVAITVFIGAIVSTWQWTAWTVLFQRLQGEKPQSTLLRWFGRRP